MRRFAATSRGGAAGAIAHFLSYYGAATLPAQVDLPEAPTLLDLQRVLKEGFGVQTQIVPLADRLPRIAAIVELPGARFGVLAEPVDGAGWLFEPDGANVRQLNEGKRKTLRTALALLPVWPN
jgi:hypothetical protein